MAAERLVSAPSWARESTNHSLKQLQLEIIKFLSAVHGRHKYPSLAVVFLPCSLATLKALSSYK